MNFVVENKKKMFILGKKSKELHFTRKILSISEL